MTTDRDFDTLLRSWFDASASPAQPQDLVESVRATTARTRPRPAWLVRMGGEPMSEVSGSGLSRFAAIGLSVVAVVAAILVGLSLVWGPWRNIGPEPQESATPTNEAPSSPRAASWTLTGSMVNGGDGHAAVLLSDGRVFALGEIYDPTSGTWSSADGPTTAGAATATLLVDGTILVLGDSPETFDPTTNTWTATGPMVAPRSEHTATRLLDGRVLVAGGMGPNGSYDYLASAEIYDPATRTWSATGGMLEARGAHGIGVLAGHTATLLPDGKVLVAGGRGTPFLDLRSAELYDPGSGTWSPTGSMLAAHEFHTATLLTNGLVLLVGGETAELYDPGSGTWSPTRSPTIPRSSHTATLLIDGSVLVAGGEEASHRALPGAELYDPNSALWIDAGAMNAVRAWHSATLLADGRVLIAGGESYAGGGTWLGLRSAELYEPGVSGG